MQAQRYDRNPWVKKGHKCLNVSSCKGGIFWTSTFARTKLTLSKQLVSWCLFSASFDKIPTYSKCTAVKMFQYNCCKRSSICRRSSIRSRAIQYSSISPPSMHSTSGVYFCKHWHFLEMFFKFSFLFLFFGGNVFWCEERFSWWKGRDINVHISKHRFLKHTHRDLEMMWHNLWPNIWKFGNYWSNNSDTWILAQYLESNFSVCDNTGHKNWVSSQKQLWRFLSGN